MEDLDLDLDNYDLDDLLNLFHLSYNFDEKDLKKAYRMVLRTHPDKSNLCKEIFLFFMKAYEMVENVFNFRNTQTKSTTYIVEKDEDKIELLQNINGMKVKDFNKWFNKMFEKHKISEEDEEGYGDWFKNTEDKAITKISKREFDSVFKQKKEESRALVKKSDLVNMRSYTGSDLLRERPEYYESGIFSKLQYEDLKKAHTETVIPVTEQDYLNKEKFGDVDSYKRHRAKAINMPSLSQSREYLNNRKNENNIVDTQRAYKLLKRDEELKKKNNDFWAELQLLKN